MKVLVIDDSPEKAALIEEEIRKCLFPDAQCTISVVDTLQGAVRSLSVIKFDLVILDLMLPYIDDGEANSRAGLELLRQLRNTDGLNKAVSVLALSSFPEEIASFRSSFDEMGVLITAFDSQDLWRKALQNVVGEAKSKAGRMIDVDFLIVCALEKERNGFRSFLKEESDASVAGLNVRFVSTLGDHKKVGAIVRLSRMGLVTATFETAAALSVFRTKVVCMSGICAGFKEETKLGQIVIASPAWEYQAGKWSKEGFEISPLQVGLPPATRATIDTFVGTQSFIQALEEKLPDAPRPEQRASAILAPFATGSAVIADPKRLKHIEQQHRKVAALDMETYGLYYSANESVNSATHFFAAKAVVDFADDSKDDRFHEYGCVVSANACMQIIAQLLRD